MNEIKTMHLFAGVGGGILADLILGHRPIVAVEWDKYACKVLRERVADTQLSLEPSVYLHRKEREEAKLDALISFVQSDQCRSRLISEYFDGEPHDCGICDNCLRQEFDSKSLHEIILAKLPASFAHLEQEIPATKDLLQKAIRSLMHDEVIYYEEGTYFKAK